MSESAENEEPRSSTQERWNPCPIHASQNQPCRECRLAAEKDAPLTESAEHVDLTNCGLSREDFGPTDGPCSDGGLPHEHPWSVLCGECKRPLQVHGTCCWPDLCGDCEDANEAALGGAR